MRETQRQQQSRLAQIEQAKAFNQPGRKGAKVYKWEEERPGQWIRRYVERGEVPFIWHLNAKSHKFYTGHGRTAWIISCVVFPG